VSLLRHIFVGDDGVLSWPTSSVLLWNLQAESPYLNTELYSTVVVIIIIIIITIVVVVVAVVVVVVVVVAYLCDLWWNGRVH